MTKAPSTCFLCSDHWSAIARRLRLSHRETEIVALILGDENEAAIAQELGISSHTVHTHLERLHRKLHVSSRCQVILRVFQEYVYLEGTQLLSHVAPEEQGECGSAASAITCSADAREADSQTADFCHRLACCKKRLTPSTKRRCEKEVRIMATITNATLSLTHDHTKRTVRAVVNCKVNFTALELCQMKACRESRFFKLKCQLWGSDSGLTGADDFLFTYSNVFFFPDPTPSSPESRTFDVLLGEGVLDEDWGQDEVYGLLRLVNLATLIEIRKKTNTVSHSF